MSLTNDHEATDSLVPPSTYRWVRDGRSSKVYVAGDGEFPQPSARSSSPVPDNTPSFSALPFLRRRTNSDGFQLMDPSPPAYYLEYTKTPGYILWGGPGPKDPSGPGQRLLTMKNEARWSSTSTFAEVNGQMREITMYKADGPQGDRWWGRNRTLTDFDGNEYSMKTSTMDHVTLIRKSDQVVVAHFQRDLWSYTQMGMLEVKEAVSSGLLHLILGLMAVRYRKAKQQRD